MNVSDALTFLKGAYQATLSPCNPYRRAGDVVAQAINDLQSRCRALENSRESRILALQEQVAKSAALQAARDALATQLAAARQVGDERLRLLNEMVSRCQLLERTGQVSEQFRKDPQNHAKTWDTSYTKKVVDGLQRLLNIRGFSIETQASLADAVNLLADYHKTSHVVYQDRDAAQAQRDKVAAELSKLCKELRSRVREQLLEISSQFGTSAARAIFVSAAPGKSCLSDVDDSAMPGLLTTLTAQWARKSGEAGINVANPVPPVPLVPRKAVYGDLYHDFIWLPKGRLNFCFPFGDFVTSHTDVDRLHNLSFTTQSKWGAKAVDEAAKARQAARLRLLKTLARWRNPDAKPRMSSFRLIESLEEFIKALK